MKKKYIAPKTVNLSAKLGVFCTATPSTGSTDLSSENRGKQSSFVDETGDDSSNLWSDSDN